MKARRLNLGCLQFLLVHPYPLQPSLLAQALWTGPPGISFLDQTPDLGSLACAFWPRPFWLSSLLPKPSGPGSGPQSRCPVQCTQCS